MAQRALTCLALALALALAACGDGGEPNDWQPAGDASAAVPTGDGSVLSGSLPLLNGERQDLAEFEGDVVLVVNTASECGYSPQFGQLQTLYEKRRGDGLEILGFPADDVAGQEPRDDAAIAEYCEANFGVEFPMFAKSDVLGESANPLFKRLTAAAGVPEWNFNKYLLDRRGRVVERFGVSVEPDDPELLERIEALL